MTSTATGGRNLVAVDSGTQGSPTPAWRYALASQNYADHVIADANGSALYDANQGKAIFENTAQIDGTARRRYSSRQSEQSARPLRTTGLCSSVPGCGVGPNERRPAHSAADHIARGHQLGKPPAGAPRRFLLRFHRSQQRRERGRPAGSRDGRRTPGRLQQRLRIWTHPTASRRRHPYPSSGCAVPLDDRRRFLVLHHCQSKW